MPPVPARRPRKRRKAPWIFAGLGVVVLVAVVGFVASTYFSHATFTIVPRSIPVNVNSTYIAQGTPATGALSYDLVPVQGTASSTVVAVDGPAVSTKAQGKVTLYNAYSAQAQRLIAGTRIAGMIRAWHLPSDRLSGDPWLHHQERQRSSLAPSRPPSRPTRPALHTTSPAART